MNIKSILCLSSAFILLNCSSPLSDIAISDPSVIYPNISVDHIDSEDGLNSMISVSLNDKNGAFIELKEGNVKVNDEELSYAYTNYTSNKSVKEKSKYVIAISLADSAIYSSEVTTPSFINKVDFPNKINKNESFNVTWNNNYPEGDTKVMFAIRDTANDWITLYEEDFKSTSTALVSPTIYPDYECKEGKLTLTRIHTGKLDSKFPGGRIESIVLFERNIKIK